MKKNIVLTLATVLLAVQQIFAVPAYPNPITYTLPDGSEITIQLRGNENLNWVETLDGFTLLRNSEGFFEYATVNEVGDLTLSGRRVNDMRRRTPSEQDFLRTLERGLMFSDSQIETKLELRGMRDERLLEFLQQAQAENPQQTSGTVRIPVILIGFQDRPFTRSRADFEMLFNQLNYTLDGAFGSVRDYFRAISYDQLDLQADIFGPFDLPNTVAFYTQNAANRRTMATQAIDLARAQGANFSNYARNGVVPAVHLIFAGHCGAAGASNTFWSSAALFWPEFSRDGVRINVNCISPEFRGNPTNNPNGNLARIGTIVHELGHSFFGWPDSYSVTRGANTGGCVDLNFWCVMAAGAWGGDMGARPTRPSAWFLVDAGWVPEITLTTPQHVTIPNPVQTGRVYRINTTTTGEYFLLENRQQVGWDLSIPSSGMIIYHVDRTPAALRYWGLFWLPGNEILTHCNRRRLYIKQPGCNVTNGCGAVDGWWRGHDAWPRPGFTAFTDHSIPNSRSWSGALTNRSVTSIVHHTSTRTISFEFMADAAANNLEIATEIFPHTQIPTFQRLPASLSARAVNSGTSVQSNVRFSATLNGNPIGQSDPVASIAVGAISPTMTFETHPRLIHSGDNTIVYIVSGAQTNQGTKNTDTFTFVGTDGVLAVDKTTNFMGGIGSNTGPISFGNIFEITDTAIITGIHVGFGGSSTLNYSVSVHAMTGVSTIASSPLLTQEATRDTNGFSTVSVTKTQLNPGRYFVSVNQLSETNVAVAFDEVAGRSIHIRDGNNLAANGNFGALAIRMELAKPSPIYSIALSKTDTFAFRDAFYGYGEQTALEVVIANTGNRPTGELTIALNGENPSSFTLSAATVPSISIHDVGAFTVVPNTNLEIGTYTATVTVTGENDISKSFTVSFTVNEIPTFGIMLSHVGTYTFTSVFSGYDINEIIPLDVIITNVGYEPTGALTIALSGENADYFTLSTTAIPSIAVEYIDYFTVVPKADLPVGVYTATITVTGENEILEYFHVSLTVSPVMTNILLVETHNYASLQVFPNPTFDGRFFIEIPDNIEDRTIRIYNLSGQLVLSRPANRQETEIDISHLPNGTYILRVGHLSSRIIKR